MHELSVCRSLLRQVEALASEHGARRVTGITLRIGPLSGVEPDLLRAAYRFARAGTLACDAALTIERPAVEVWCPACAARRAASPADLACAACGSLRTTLASGDECLLTGLDLVPAAAPGA